MRKYGLLGEKLSHSFSPQIHKYFYDNPYTLFEVEAEKIEAFLKSDKFDAINVTIPYKKTVMPFCAELSETAKKVGSVNTLLKREDGSLYGDNTDYFGFSYLAEKNGISFEDKKVLILGSGGSSLMVQTVAKDSGAGEIIVVSRSGENNYENISRHYDADIIVNTTPLGMYPKNGVAPIELKNFKNCVGVLDLIYNPAKTKLLLDAENLGITAANGLLMLVAQAKRAAEIFSGSKIENSVIDKITCEISKSTKNIVLIGMPGCGKSTIGREIANICGREFIDTDEIITERSQSPSVIIKNNGEEAFRKIETEILEEVSKLSGKVIATGGGIVTREENYPLVKQNSIVCFVERDIELLATGDRPLSQRGGVYALWEKRKNLYEKFADIKIENKNISEVVEKIREVCKI